jgi:hypothetical protein
MAYSSFWEIFSMGTNLLASVGTGSRGVNE